MPKEEEKISIVIPVCNGAGTIERCVRSVLAQSYGNREIIVVDDGSTDETPEILAGLCAEQKELSVIRQENQGVAAARNTGIGAASGTWLAMLDADDFMDPEMLSVMHASAKTSEAQLVICGFRRIYAGSERKEMVQVPDDFEGNQTELINTVFLQLYDSGLLQNQNNKLYRLDLIRKAGIRYDASMQSNESLWFALRAIGCCGEITVLHRAFLNSMQHPEGEGLAKRFHPNGVETCFSVLSAYDALFDGCAVSDRVVNEMNNRMLKLICAYTDAQYYRSAYSDDEILRNVRSLCEREELRRLLEQTDPIGLPNSMAYFLLKRKKAEAYHRLCLLRYRRKWKVSSKAPEELQAEEPAAEEDAVKETAAEETVAEENTAEEYPEGKNIAEEYTEEEQATEKKTAEELAEENTAGEPAACETAEDTEAAAGDPGAGEATETTAAESEEAGSEAPAEEAVPDPPRAVVIKQLSLAEVEQLTEEPAEVQKEAETEKTVKEQEEPAEETYVEVHAYRRRHPARRPRSRGAMEGQMELWDLMGQKNNPARRRDEDLSDAELDEISKKLEGSLDQR